MINRFLALFLTIVGICGAEVAGGVYAGKWTDDQSSGDLRMVLTKASDGSWKAEASFTIDQNDVQTQMKSVKVNGDEVELVFTFDGGGAPMQAVLKGKALGGKVEGSYTTTAEDGSKVGEGTWIVRPAEK